MAAAGDQLSSAVDDTEVLWLADALKDARVLDVNERGLEDDESDPTFSVDSLAEGVGFDDGVAPFVAVSLGCAEEDAKVDALVVDIEEAPTEALLEPLTEALATSDRLGLRDTVPDSTADSVGS